MLIDACDGLLACHSGCGGVWGSEILLHRDVKPGSILLRWVGLEGRVVAALGGFGVSELLPATPSGLGRWTTQNVKGTPGCEICFALLE